MTAAGDFDALAEAQRAADQVACQLCAGCGRVHRTGGQLLVRIDHAPTCRRRRPTPRGEPMTRPAPETEAERQERLRWQAEPDAGYRHRMHAEDMREKAAQLLGGRTVQPAEPAAPAPAPLTGEAAAKAAIGAGVGLTPQQSQHLRGSSPEELQADAAALVAAWGPGAGAPPPPPGPAPDPSQGARGAALGTAEEASARGDFATADRLAARQLREPNIR